MPAFTMVWCVSCFVRMDLHKPIYMIPYLMHEGAWIPQVEGCVIITIHMSVILLVLLASAEHEKKQT